MNTIADFLRHYFIPHQSNNHRPRMLHPSFLAYCAIFLILLQLVFRMVHTSRPYILGIAIDIRISELLQDTNDERIQHGLAPLTINKTLSQAAEDKARDMFTKDYWAHTAPDGTTPWDFIVKENYKYVYAGENLARDFAYSQNVVDAWMNSPSHRENILRSEYKEIGFAVVNGKLSGEDTTLVVQMFGTPQTATIKPVVAAEQHPIVPVAAAAITTSAPVRTAASGISLGVVQAPAFDQFTTMRIISLLIIGSLLGVLAIDGFVILKRKTVRIAGHNFAHFIFLISIAGIILLSTSGGIM